MANKYIVFAFNLGAQLDKREHWWHTFLNYINSHENPALLWILKKV